MKQVPSSHIVFDHGVYHSNSKLEHLFSPPFLIGTSPRHLPGCSLLCSLNILCTCFLCLCSSVCFVESLNGQQLSQLEETDVKAGPHSWIRLSPNVRSSPRTACSSFWIFLSVFIPCHFIFCALREKKWHPLSLFCFPELLAVIYIEIPSAVRST